MIEEITGKKLVPLFDEKDLKDRVKDLGEQISSDFPEGVTIIGVLKGSFIFVADLVREIKCPVQVEFIGVSSYEGTETTGHVRITNDLTGDIAGKDVILVEDIVDTGNTIDYLLNVLEVRSPSSLRICTLLSKPECHQMQHQLDYVGFQITKEFVIGYGLDLEGRYRQLPSIMQLIDP